MNGRPPLLRAPDGVEATPRPQNVRQFELTEKVRAYDPRADTDLLDAAYVLAAQAHGTQLRENGDPYITHPLAVADILAGYRLDTASIVTALLHDVIEDTGVTRAEIDRRFGTTVGALVDGVTKLNRLELQDDRTKQAENFRKLVLAMSEDIRVLLVKLADRLHNMRTLHYVDRPEKRLRVARETMEIYAPLAERIGMDSLKSELQTLAFAQLEPEAFATIQARLNFLRGQGADMIDGIKQELAQVCTEAGAAPIEVTGREKSIYSIWEKMQRRNVAFEQLSDIMAFRVVMPSRDSCYVALGAIHAAYPVITGRFKDYISTPKSNGYRSIHTGVTLRVPQNQKIEVQIRTAEMHDVAENGVAAHWLYKQDDAAGPDASAELQTYRWMSDLLEILETSQAADEFLENTKLELYQDQVFCFTPKGQLIPLPRGATPVDFAYAVHSQVGDRCVGSRVNGRIVPLRHELENGDQVEIMTSKAGTPSPAWERFVVTGKARARIRRFVAQTQRQEYLDQGRASLAKAFRQQGVEGSEKVLDGTLKALKAPSLDDLYVAVGNGNIGAKDVVHTAYPELRGALRAPRIMPTLPLRSGRSGKSEGMPVTGLVSGMVIHYAGCCHPLPGDRIVGIVSQGKGVTIHARDCPTAEAFSATPERYLDVDWDAGEVAREGATHTGRILAVATNQTGALASLANAVAKHDGVISNLKVTNRQQDFFEVLMDVDVRDVRHLSTVIAGLRATGGVTQVERARG